jgi:hypothetical protein
MLADFFQRALSPILESLPQLGHMTSLTWLEASEANRNKEVESISPGPTFSLTKVMNVF